MPYAENFTTLTMNGTLADGDEIWSAGLHIRGQATFEGEWFTFFSTRANELRDICEAYISDVATNVPAGAKLTSIKLSRRGTDGKYMNAPIEVQADAQGAITNSYAPQNSMVNTLVSSRWKDPGRYNRFYLPFAFGSISGDYELDSVRQAAYVGALATFIGEINDVLEEEGPGASAAVAVLSNSATGTPSLVEEVRIGKVVDTQRRRRNKLNESYMSEPVVSI